MKYQNKCDHCGHAETAYTYNLNVGKVQALRKLVDLYEAKKKPIELGDMNISNSQYTNFCHLAYFKLAQHVPGEGWVPTPDGIEFIYGKVYVTLPVAVMNGRVLPADHEAWKTHDSPRVDKFVWDIDNLAYKKRPEYAAEKAVGLFG